MASKRLADSHDAAQVAKRLRAEGNIGDNTMIIIQDGSSVDAMATVVDEDDIMTTDGNNIALEGSSEVTLGEDDVGEDVATGYTITTADSGETYISADGQILTSVNDSQQLVITDDGQQVMLEEDDQVVMAAKDDEDVIEVAAQSEIEQSSAYQNLIIQIMDISEPLSFLRRLLEARLHCSLKQHEFYLQDTILLDPKKNLTAQCVQGTGMVQINVEVKSSPELGEKPRLNIVDILKPADDIIEEQTPEPPASQPKVVIPFPEENENVTRWIVDQAFRREQERLKIPLDPAQWNETSVNHWICWAIKEFDLTCVDPKRFAHITGQHLCEMKHSEFSRYVPDDPGDTFWTHLELLRKCRFVAVIQQPTPHAITTITVSSSDPLAQKTHRISRPANRKSIFFGTDRISPGNRTGNNGQIQLWQFLLELLTDKDYREIIHWVGDDGEFKLANPEIVAQLWGTRKNKATMNYEKLSRALRYYYDGDMIAKVHGKRFVYKFVCDLRMLLGYTAGELSRLVGECSSKQITHLRDTINTTSHERITRIPQSLASRHRPNVIIPPKCRHIKTGMSAITISNE